MYPERDLALLGEKSGSLLKRPAKSESEKHFKPKDFGWEMMVPLLLVPARYRPIILTALA